MKGENKNMKEFACPRCQSINLFTETNASQVGLYCSICGKWIKWLSKEEQRVFEKQQEMKELNKVKKIDLSQVSNEELLDEIKRRLRP
jgi:endogenous inhibitor of DNA gyrase (YacG/DUF329 family)